MAHGKKFFANLPQSLDPPVDQGLESWVLQDAVSAESSRTVSFREFIASPSPKSALSPRARASAFSFFEKATEAASQFSGIGALRQPLWRPIRETGENV